MPKALGTKAQIKKTYEEMRKSPGKGRILGLRSATDKTAPEPVNIEDEIARRKKILNDELEQDRKLKKLSLILLFLFLAAETGVVFWLAYLQGTQNNFQLEEWSFKLIIAGTIIQITLMLQIAIKYLFSKKKSDS